MKNIVKLSLVACMAISFLNAEEAKINGQIRSGYVGVDGHNEDNYATALGGMIKYESASLYDINAGFGFTTTQDVDFMSGKDDKRNEELSSAKGDYTVLGEAYLNYSNSNLNVRLGRQVVDTPLADSDDIRMVANTFEAYMATYELPNMVLTAGNLQRFQGFDAGLDDGWVKTGEDGTWLAGLAYSSTIELNAWFYDISKLTQAIYVDAGYTHEISSDISLNVAAQYLNESEVNNSAIEASIYGASVGVESNGLGLSLAYNNSARSDGKGSFSGFGGGTLFTSMDTMILDEITQDSDAQAFVVGASYAISHMNLSYAYGNFTAEDSASAKEHIVEQDIILEYEVNENLALEAIYVLSSDEESSVDTEYDFTITQVMLKYNF